MRKEACDAWVRPCCAGQADHQAAPRAGADCCRGDQPQRLVLRARIVLLAAAGTTPTPATSFETVYNSRVTARLFMRSRDEITSLCDGFTLLEPGLVWIPQWRPDSPHDVPEDPSKYWALVGVARYDGPPSPSAVAD